MPDRSLLIHLVHGAADAPKPNVPHWSDPDGSFAEAVKKKLPDEFRGRISFKPWIWNGKNSFSDRKAASHRFSEEFANQEPQSTLFIGHGQGGAVIADALAATPQGTKTPLGVCTLSTPFVERTQSTGVGGLLSVVLPAASFAVTFAAALTLLFYRQGTWATVCTVTGLLSLSAFTSTRVSRAATILSAICVLFAPLAFATFAAAFPNPFGLFLAMLLGCLILLGSTYRWWSPITEMKKRDWSGIPRAFDLPAEPNVSLLALRLPGDEGSSAIAAAQAVRWVDATGLIGAVARLFRQINGVRDPRPYLVFAGLWTAFSIFAAIIKPADGFWLMVPVNGLFYLTSTLILWTLVVGLFVLWARVLTTMLVAAASGMEVLDDVGLVDVYAEPLPRWNSHKNCRLEILHWQAADLNKAPMSPVMHQLGFVQQRVADWIVEKLTGKDVAVSPSVASQPTPPRAPLVPPLPPRMALHASPQVRVHPEIARIVPKSTAEPLVPPTRPADFQPR